MNRHTKIAIFIAPFLVVGGYIAADYYAQEWAEKQNLFKLTLDGRCNLQQSPCIVKNKQLTVKLSNKNNITQIESNRPLEKVHLSFVDKDNKETHYLMKAEKSKQLWYSETIASALLKQSSEIKIRIIGFVNKGYYFSEFYSIEY